MNPTFKDALRNLLTDSLANKDSSAHEASLSCNVDGSHFMADRHGWRLERDGVGAIRMDRDASPLSNLQAGVFGLLNLGTS
jgi:hypothetical protein